MCDTLGGVSVGVQMPRLPCFGMLCERAGGWPCCVSQAKQAAACRATSMGCVYIALCM